MAADGPFDVTAVLTDQHQQIMTITKQVVSAQGQDRRAAFDQARVLLAAHDAAEDEVVHAIVRQDHGSDADVVNQRLAEEEDAANSSRRSSRDLDADLQRAMVGALTQVCRNWPRQAMAN